MYARVHPEQGSEEKKNGKIGNVCLLSAFLPLLFFLYLRPVDFGVCSTKQNES